MNEREQNKRIVAEVFDGVKSIYEIAKTIKQLTGRTVCPRTLERYEQELRTEGLIGYRQSQLVKGDCSDRQFKKQFTERYTDMICSLKEILSEVTPLPKPKYSKNQVGDTLNILLSDWHIGREIKDENGVVVYNTDIAEKQVNAFTNEALKLSDKYISKSTKIQEVNIIAAGDMLDGMGIFSTQESMSEYAPPFQVMRGIEYIQKIILAYRQRGFKVNFYGVKGNHGEIRFNGKSKDPNANWDLMLYLMLEFWAKSVVKDNMISIQYSELDYLNFDVRGWTYHVRHKAPAQSETPSGKAKFLGWVKKHKCDLVMYGHYHHYGINDRSGITIIRNGALTAGDEFAESLAEESEPVQLVFGCNENRPVTFIYPIDLGTRKKGA